MRNSNPQLLRQLGLVNHALVSETEEIYSKTIGTRDRAPATVVRVTVPAMAIIDEIAFATRSTKGDVVALALSLLHATIANENKPVPA
jgi:hypothetical protein